VILFHSKYIVLLLFTNLITLSLHGRYFTGRAVDATSCAAILFFFLVAGRQRTIDRRQTSMPLCLLMDEWKVSHRFSDDRIIYCVILETVSIHLLEDN
jgi:hypothetical protein